MEKSKFYPQHLCKCYCQKSCFCESVEKPMGTHPKFVKLRSESGFIKPKSERILFSGPNSRCTSRTSAGSTPHQLGPTSSSEFERKSNTSSDLTMTNNRINYERAKQALAEPSVAHSTHSRDWNVSNCPSGPQVFHANLEEDRIKGLNDFRLENSQDCFSVLSRHSINQRLGKYRKIPEDHICEFVYRLNSRGLLSPTNIDDDGRLVCAVCQKTEKSLDPMGVVTMHETDKPHKVILQISDDVSQTGKGTRLWTPARNNVPANSLALRYQRLI